MEFLLESLVVTERDSEVSTSNFHGLENIHTGCTLVLTKLIPFIFSELISVGVCPTAGSTPLLAEPNYGI